VVAPRAAAADLLFDEKAGAAAERVGTQPADQLVFADAAAERVVAVVPAQRVPTESSLQKIVAVAPGHERLPRDAERDDVGEVGHLDDDARDPGRAAGRLIGRERAASRPGRHRSARIGDLVRVRTPSDEDVVRFTRRSDVEERAAGDARGPRLCAGYGDESRRDGSESGAP
jgi:hypothetical protein